MFSLALFCSCCCCRFFLCFCSSFFVHKVKSSRRNVPREHAHRKYCTITQVFYRKRITTTRPPTKHTSISLAKKLVGQGVQGLHFGASGANNDASAGKVVGALERLKRRDVVRKWQRAQDGRCNAKHCDAFQSSAVMAFTMKQFAAPQTSLCQP